MVAGWGASARTGLGRARFCGGMAYPERRFDAEGYRLLNVMQRLGLILDLSHMNEISTLQALDHYQGPIVATHANARAVLGKPDFERHFTDQTIRRLVERDGVIGTVPFSVFLRGDWKKVRTSDAPASAI